MSGWKSTNFWFGTNVNTTVEISSSVEFVKIFYEGGINDAKSPEAAIQDGIDNYKAAVGSLVYCVVSDGQRPTYEKTKLTATGSARDEEDKDIKKILKEQYPIVAFAYAAYHGNYTEDRFWIKSFATTDDGKALYLGFPAVQDGMRSCFSIVFCDSITALIAAGGVSKMTQHLQPKGRQSMMRFAHSHAHFSAAFKEAQLDHKQFKKSINAVIDSMKKHNQSPEEGSEAWIFFG